MSDDLVKRLWLLDMHPESAPRQAADRIEAQAEEIERLRKRADALAEKLEKAVAVLAELATDEHPQGWIAIAALTELNGD